MNEVGLFFLGYFVLSIPVKFAAGVMETQRSGWLICFGATILTGVLNNIVTEIIPKLDDLDIIGLIISFIIMSFVFAKILGTNIYKGMGIHALSIVITFLALWVISNFMGGTFTVNWDT